MDSSWITVISTLASGLFTYLVTRASNKPKHDTMVSKHSEMLLNQYSAEITRLKGDIQYSDQRVRELRDSYDEEVKELGNTIDELEQANRELKDKLIDIEYLNKRLHKKIQEQALELKEYKQQGE